MQKRKGYILIARASEGLEEWSGRA